MLTTLKVKVRERQLHYIDRIIVRFSHLCQWDDAQKGEAQPRHPAQAGAMEERCRGGNLNAEAHQMLKEELEKCRN
ncbi:MAG TPA: hypothetical protein VFQ47_06780 [Nitrososphaera sp.]|nr:hypothetical protein [Nitrososphaera sp.]